MRDRHVEALRAEVRTKDDQNHQLQEEIADKDDQLQDEIAARDDQMGRLMRQLEVSDLLTQAPCKILQNHFRTCKQKSR